MQKPPRKLWGAFLMEPSRRFELRSDAYKATALPIELTRQKLEHPDTTHTAYLGLYIVPQVKLLYREIAGKEVQ